MVSFEKKELSRPKRVCLRLKEKREARGLTISEVAKRTRISQKYPEALEQCRFHDIPFGTVYQKNFIKRYASALGVPHEEFLEQFLDEEVPTNDTRLPPPTKQKNWSSYLPAIIRSTLLAGVLFATIGYLGIQVKQSIEPPSLIIYTPTDGFIAYAPEIIVHGTTEKEAQVFINNEPIILHDDGQFEEQMYLSDGVNTISISAKKKHGKTTVETRHVILKKTEELTLRNMP